MTNAWYNNSEDYNLASKLHTRRKAENICVHGYVKFVASVEQAYTISCYDIASEMGEEKAGSTGDNTSKTNHHNFQSLLIWGS